MPADYGAKHHQVPADSSEDTLLCLESLFDNDDGNGSVVMDDLSDVSQVSPTGELSMSSPTLPHLLQIFKIALNKSMMSFPSANFLENHKLHPLIRADVVCWLVELSQALQLQQETLFSSILMFDRFLSKSCQVVPRSSLQLLAVACASLASKQHELCAPASSVWVSMAKETFSDQELTRMEWLIMITLNWQGLMPTVYTFLHLYCYALGDCPEVCIAMASYLVELSALEYSVLKYPPAVVAAAALALAQATMSKDQCLFPIPLVWDWLGPLQSLIVPCIKSLLTIHRSVCSNQLTGAWLAAVGPVKEKYASSTWFSVCEIHPLPCDEPSSCE